MGHVGGRIIGSGIASTAAPTSMIEAFIATADPGLPLEFLELPEHLMNAPTIDEEDSSNYKYFDSIATTIFGLDSQETHLESYEGF